MLIFPITFTVSSAMTEIAEISGTFRTSQIESESYLLESGAVSVTSAEQFSLQHMQEEHKQIDLYLITGGLRS